jgi:hypothetical protein
LNILRLSEKETDVEAKVRPTVTYLQRLGPEYLAQVYEYSKWVLAQDREIGFEVSSSPSTMILSL